MTKVKINEKQYEIKKLPLGKYSQVLKAFEKLPAHLASMDNLNENKIIEAIPTIGADALPEVIEVTAIATDIPKEEIANDMGIADLVVLWEAIFKVNDFQLIKKVIGRLRGGTKETNG